MKRFLFGRLKSQQLDYDYYIPPQHKLGKLHLPIASDLLPAKNKLLLLQRHEGKITFGVREQLDLRDQVGRLRANFMGYQLDPSESAEDLPFYDALQEKFPAIRDEAHQLNSKLDQSTREAMRSSRARLQNMDIEFSPGNYQAGNAWDEAVIKLRNSNADMLMMFDEHGKDMAGTLKGILKRHEPSTAGIQSGVTSPALKAPEKEFTASATSRLEKAAAEQLTSGNKLAIIGGGVTLLAALGYWVFQNKYENNKPDKSATTQNAIRM